MRIAFATTNLSLPRDLAEGYASIEVTGVYPSYRSCVDGLMAKAGDERRAIDVLVIADDLVAAEDRAVEMTMEQAIVDIRAAHPRLRILVMSRVPGDDARVTRLHVERFVLHDMRGSVNDLANILGTAAKADIAKVIAVTGTQGGAGRTTLARAIADSLSDYVSKTSTRGGVLLWELDLTRSVLAFDQEIDLIGSEHGRRTIARLLNAAPVHGDEDLSTIRESIFSRDKSHLPFDVLLAPHGIREAMAVYQSYPSLIDLRNRLADLLAILSRHYQAIVADLSPLLIGDPGASVVLPRASHIAVMATPSPAGLSSVISMRHIISDLRAESRSRLVLNRVRREDAMYLKYCQTKAHGVMDILAQVREGEHLADFPVLGPKLLGLDR